MSQQLQPRHFLSFFYSSHRLAVRHQNIKGYCVMSSEGLFDVDFNETLAEKLRNLLVLPLEDTRDGIQEALDLLEQRNERRRFALTDEISRMPAEMRCAVFKNYSDSDLVDCIIAYEELESTAGLVLQHRKYEVMLTVGPIDGAYCDDLELHVQCDIRKADKTYAKEDYEYDFSMMKKLSFSTRQTLSDYFCGFLRVVLLFMSSSVHGISLKEIGCSSLDPENYFGPAATDVNDKSACGRLFIDRGVFAPLLQWIRPSELKYEGGSQLLFNTHGELTIEGVKKVHLHVDTFSCCNVNAVLMKCKAETIHLGGGTFWSRLGFNAVLTEHANSREAGRTREIRIDEVPSNENAEEADDEWGITYYCQHRGWSMHQWTQRYDDWRAGHVAEHGEPGRDVTYEAVDEWDVRTFKLILH